MFTYPPTSVNVHLSAHQCNMGPNLDTRSPSPTGSSPTGYFHIKIVAWVKKKFHFVCHIQFFSQIFQQHILGISSENEIFVGRLENLGSYSGFPGNIPWTEYSDGGDRRPTITSHKLPTMQGDLINRTNNIQTISQILSTYFYRYFYHPNTKDHRNLLYYML